MTPAGLEPAIPGSVGRCLIHWATGPVATSATSEGLFALMLRSCMDAMRCLPRNVKIQSNSAMADLCAGMSALTHNMRKRIKLKVCFVNCHRTCNTIRPCGLMDKALVFGTKDWRFESCQGHFLHSLPRSTRETSSRKAYMAATTHSNMCVRISISAPSMRILTTREY